MGGKNAAWAAVVLGGALVSAAIGGEPLPGTKPLTMEGDIASQLVDGVDRFLLRKNEESIEKRAAFWKRDLSTPEKYAASIAPNRARLAHIIGVRDPRVPFEAPELVGTTAEPALVGKGDGYEIFAIRWPSVGDIHGEGLLLVPSGKPVADVVAIPDAGQTPEQIAGLVEGVDPESQFARTLVELGCRVVVPVLIDRKEEDRWVPPGGARRAKLTSREFLYRSSFELGRHPIGYEVQKVLAAVDWFVKDAKGADPKVGVFGYGEGGLIALYSGAIDTRIDAVWVSSYIESRQNLWQEPIDRNVFGLLEQFGDAEILSMVAPRPYFIEAARGPEVVIAPGGTGGPGSLTTPEAQVARAESRRVASLTEGVVAEMDRRFFLDFQEGRGPFGHPGGLILAVQGLEPALVNRRPSNELPRALRKSFDPEARQARQIHEIDRHNQLLLAQSQYVRRAYFSKLDSTSLASFEKTIEPYRTTFRDDVIGRFDDAMLPPDPRSRKVYDEETFTGYEVVMDVFPDVIAYGILLVPKGINDGEKRPVVVCQHGLEGRVQDVADPKVDKPAYHKFAVTLAERGFVTFSPQNLYIFKDRFRTLQRKANPLKKTLFSIIVPQHQQITDWLKTLDFVDPARIGFYGLSYGGKSAMRIPPLVSNYALSICSADFNEWVAKNASTVSPYSYIWTGEYEIFEWDLGSTFNYSEMAALIAPRPFMVERGHFDTVGSDDAVASEFAKVRFLYEAKLGIGDRCELEWFVGPHTIHGVGTYDFLHKHLSLARVPGER